MSRRNAPTSTATKFILILGAATFFSLALREAPKPLPAKPSLWEQAVQIRCSQEHLDMYGSNASDWDKERISACVGRWL